MNQPSVLQMAFATVLLFGTNISAETAKPNIILFGDWKFLRFYEDGHEELYDLRNDIGESKNLFASMPRKAAELKDQLDATLKAHCAMIPTAVPAKSVRPTRKKKATIN